MSELAQSGSIKKVNLKEINNFIFSFPELSVHEQSALKGIVSIDSELGGVVNISASNLEARLTMGRTSNQNALFFIEPIEDDPNRNVSPVSDDVQVYASNGFLKISSQTVEKITLYNISGIAVIQLQKSTGEAIYSIDCIPKGIYIVSGSSGWAKKVVL